MVASGPGAQMGVLFRDAAAIETLRSVDTLVLDKTGTITIGKPTLNSVLSEQGFDENELPAIGAGLEQSSEHPILGKDFQLGLLDHARRHSGAISDSSVIKLRTSTRQSSQDVSQSLAMSWRASQEFLPYPRFLTASHPSSKRACGNASMCFELSAKFGQREIEREAWSSSMTSSLQ